MYVKRVIASRTHSPRSAGGHKGRGRNSVCFGFVHLLRKKEGQRHTAPRLGLWLPGREGGKGPRTLQDRARHQEVSMGISGSRNSEGEPTYPNGSSLIHKMSIKAYSPEEAAAIYSLYARRHCAKHSTDINFPPIALWNQY